MKNKNNFLKRIGALLIVLTLIAGMTSGVVVSAGETGSIAGSSVEGLLKHLDIIDVEREAYKEVITRGQLAKIAAKVMNLGDYTGEEELFFFDVPKESDYYSAVGSLVKAGIINGDGGGSNDYRPHDGATLNEACKVFSVILGYDDLGSFTSFLQTAMKAGILDGVGSNALLTYEDALIMAYNTLHAEMLEVIGVSVGTRPGTNYEVTEDYLAIERYHGLKRCSGVVTGAAGTTLKAADDSIGSKQIRIGDKVFNWDDSSLLGKAVVFYCNVDKKGTLGEDIAYVCLNEEKSNIIVIDGPDSLGHDINTSEFKYYEGNNKKKAKLKAGYDIIYNGMVLRNETADDLMPDMGTVTLIDNNGDKVYDVVSVEEYEYIQISTINMEEGLIVSKFPIGKSYGSKDRVVEIGVYGAAGQKVRPQLATADSVVAIRSSKCDEGIVKISINILGSVMTGEVGSVSDDFVTIAGTTYKWTGATESEMEKADLKIGDKVDYYVHNGAVAMIFRASESAFNYGYLVNAAEVETDHFDSEVRFIIVDRNLEAKEYAAAKYFTIDGKKVENDKVEGKLAESAKNVKSQGVDFSLSQLIRYKVNGNGMLAAIDTNIVDGEDEKLTLKLETEVDPENIWYSATNSSFYIKKVGQDELCFTLEDPKNSFVVCDNDRDDYLSYRKTIANLFDDRMIDVTSEKREKLVWEVYNIDPETKIAEFFVVYKQKLENNDDNIGTRSNLHLVQGSRYELNEDGDKIRVVDYIYGPSDLRTAQVSEEYVGTSNFNSGDVIQLRLDSKGQIINARNIYSPTDGWNPPPLAEDAHEAGDNPNIYAPKSVYSDSVDYELPVRAVLGTVVADNGTLIAHTSSLYDGGRLMTGPGYLDNYKKGNAKAYLYDRSQARFGLQSITFPDIMTDKYNKGNGDTAIIYTNKGNLEWVYVIR